MPATDSSPRRNPAESSRRVIGDGTGGGTGGPTRRSVLLGLGLALAAPLAGCGVRLDREAPDLPLVPTRTVDPRARAVYVELGRVRFALAATRAAAAAGGASASAAATLAALHEQQEAVLLARLRELGEDPADTTRLDAATASTGVTAATTTGVTATSPPTSATSPPTSATSTVTSPATRPATSPTTSAAPASPAIAEAAGLAPDELARLDQLPADEAPLLLSLRVQRAVALETVGGSAPAWATPTIATAAEAARLVGVFRSAEYGLGVAAARTLAPTRERLTAPLAWAAAARLMLESRAGTAPTQVAPGYALPFPVTDDASALRLGQVVLSGVTDGVLAGTAVAVGNAGGMLAVLALAAIAEDGARRLGAPLRAFPGLVRR